MKRVNRDIEKFKDFARTNPAIRWFAIADSAQSKQLPNILVENSCMVRCLFGGAQDAPLARYSPHLVELCSPLHSSDAWGWISQNACSTAGVSVIATPKEFQILFDQLASCTQVKMPDAEMMFFAFWDPAILGTLVGQSDDLTLHVPGPVLSNLQQLLLTEGLVKWWYWDRMENLHEIGIHQQSDKAAPESFELNQQQVDELVEASVPDHVFYYINLNQPHLINSTPRSERYGVVREALVHARETGLATMRDLTDFVCISLIFKERMHKDEQIVDLLSKVRMNKLGFREALDEFP